MLNIRKAFAAMAVASGLLAAAPANALTLVDFGAAGSFVDDGILYEFTFCAASGGYSCTSVDVNPSSGTDPGIVISTNSFEVNSTSGPSTLDVSIVYTATTLVAGTMIEEATGSFDPTVVSDAIANVTETIYDRNLAADPGLQVGQFALEVNPGLAINDVMGSATFVATDRITVIKDISVNVNKGTSASIGRIHQNHVLAERVLIPVPASAAFLLGPIALVAVSRRKAIKARLLQS